MEQVVNMQVAKTNLSKLVAAALMGEVVVIANRGVPAVMLAPVAKPKKRTLGFIKGTLPKSFFEPLAAAEVKSWGL